jgi:hypothetical protein
MRILICGDRHWTDRRSIEAYLSKYEPETTVVVHGGAQGADTIAGEAAVQMGMVVEKYLADWQQYGRAAGPIRNRQMLDSQVDLVVWFHLDIDSSKGTKNMVAEADRAGVDVLEGYKMAKDNAK